MNISHVLAENSKIEFKKSFTFALWKIHVYKVKKSRYGVQETYERKTLDKTMDEQAVWNSLR